VSLSCARSCAANLTVAQGQEPVVLDRIEAELAGSLPIAAHVSSVRLHVYSGGRWHEERACPLAVAARSGMI
jgi:hypothetical protein